MLSEKIIDKAVGELSKRLRVGNEIVEKDGRLHMNTILVLGNRTVYTHELDLEPLIAEIVSRIEPPSQ